MKTLDQVESDFVVAGCWNTPTDTMACNSDGEEEQAPHLMNFMFGNINEKGEAEADFLDEVKLLKNFFLLQGKMYMP